MADIEDYVTVYESTDGGTGDPRKTFWQFFVGATTVSTDNPPPARRNNAVCRRYEQQGESYV